MQLQVLKEFLEKVRCKKRQQLDQLNRELKLVEEDCNLVEVKEFAKFSKLEYRIFLAVLMDDLVSSR